MFWRSTPEFGQELRVVRLLPNGDIDTDFGQAGSWMPDGSALALQAIDVAVQPDAKVLVLGSIRQHGFVIRLGTDGQIDTGFGHGGIATIRETWITSTAVDTEGNLLVTGLLAPTWQVFLRRLRPNGAVDTTFGEGGLRVVDPPLSIGNWGNIPSVASLPVSASLVSGLVDGQSTVLRFDAEGALDVGFGKNGVVIGEASSFWSALRTANAEGGFYFMGSGGIRRFLPNGFADPAFAGGEGATLSVPGRVVQSVSLAVTRDQKAVVAGVALGAANSRLVVGRFRTDGAPDETFGDRGVSDVTEAVGMGYQSGLEVMPDGRVILFGARAADQKAESVAPFAAVLCP
jgi:uncharacterized delta-60 repeat protein